MKKIFISYKRLDKSKVLTIAEEIKRRTGLEYWIDVEGIESGDQFQNVIIDAIDNADIFIFMLSRNFIAPYKDKNSGMINNKKQSFPEKEVMYALRHNKRMIPISIDGTTISDCKWLDFNCSGLDTIEWEDTDQRLKLFDNLIQRNTKRICIIGEFSSGKTSLFLILKKFLESRYLVGKTSIQDIQNIYQNEKGFSISNIDLLGNYMEFMNNSNNVILYELSKMPHIDMFHRFIVAVDAIIYVKSIHHCEYTNNDLYRINQILESNFQILHVFTHCDCIGSEEIQDYIFKHSPQEFGLSYQNTFFIGYNLDKEQDRFIISFQQLLKNLCNT